MSPHTCDFVQQTFTSGFFRDVVAVELLQFGAVFAVHPLHSATSNLIIRP